jgi:hypothetical protein
MFVGCALTSIAWHRLPNAASDDRKLEKFMDYHGCNSKNCLVREKLPWYTECHICCVVLVSHTCATE